ncbi:MAG: DUF177 domain-containing protein [Prevotellaceae bacterium]|nr:DUF177 domain-containing protein [Prevotellaceae bacterium]
MGKFSEYIVPLRGLKDGVSVFEYKLTNDFFAKIDDADIQKGNLTAVLEVKKTGETFELNFDINGITIVACDRCLDDMEQPIATKEKLYVKFGKEFSEEGTNVIVVPFDEGEINVAWFIFEFIALNVPIKHVHLFGKCNKEMTTKLKSVAAYDKEDADTDEATPDFDSEESETDPRWDKLKELI